MSQQINLYNAAFVPPKEYLTPKSLAIVAGVLLAGVVGWTLAAEFQAQAQEAQMVALKAQVNAAQAAFEAERKEREARTEDPALAAQVANYRKQIGEREQILAITKDLLGEPGSSGYSEYLRGLSRQSVQGVWLTGLSIGSGGASIVLRGRALDKSMLPAYVQRLNSETAFRGKSFAGLQMQLKTEAPKPAAPSAAVPPASTPAKGESTTPSKYLEFELLAANAAAAEPTP
jgi:hypothetical protein